ELGPSGSGQFDANVRMRTEGTRNLVDAAKSAQARRIVAQSYAHIYAPVGGWVKSEDDPLNVGDDVPSLRRRNVEAIRSLEHLVLETPGVEGVALRYGALYGPGTAYAPDGTMAKLARIRHLPIVGDGQGRTSFIHVDDAATATVLALDGPTGVFNIVDDEPAPMITWVPIYARLLGAPSPRHVPAFVIRVLGREHFIYRATEQRGASNTKAKAILGFDPHFKTWREGFEATVSMAAAA
ncbi:MAG TPA: NAD(P)-dependent oxidoreductase, partial [Thermoleophilia bacterium]|nr:NAD(P)-dependent oxidoreductase [Thermoleophilia bacterium]